MKVYAYHRVGIDVQRGALTRSAHFNRISQLKISTALQVLPSMHITLHSIPVR